MSLLIYNYERNIQGVKEVTFVCMVMDVMSRDLLTFLLKSNLRQL